MKQILIVLDELKNGPAHAGEISECTGLSKKSVSAYLSELASCGMIKKFAINIRDSEHRSGRGFTVWELS